MHQRSHQQHRKPRPCLCLNKEWRYPRPGNRTVPSARFIARYLRLCKSSSRQGAGQFQCSVYVFARSCVPTLRLTSLYTRHSHEKGLRQCRPQCARATGSACHRGCNACLSNRCRFQRFEEACGKTLNSGDALPWEQLLHRARSLGWQSGWLTLQLQLHYASVGRAGMSTCRFGGELCE